MRIYTYPQKEVEPMMTEPELQLVPDGCFLTLPTSPDLIVTQGADLEIRICAEQYQNHRPTIACVGKDYITLDQKSCVLIGDVLELTCLEECDVFDLGQSQQKVTAISDDNLKLTLDPGFPTITTERCYRPTELMEGCLDESIGSSSPRFFVTTANWTLSGIVAHRISNGCVRSMGFTVSAGSAYVRTSLMGAVSPDDHVSIPQAGITDATVKSVRAGMQGEIPIEIIELDQSAKSSGCFPGMVADGLLLAFDISTDGTCSIGRIPASQTAKLKPPYGVDVPATADPMTFLGHYLFVAQSVIKDSNSVPQLRTQAIASGVLALRSTAIGSNQLGN